MSEPITVAHTLRGLHGTTNVVRAGNRSGETVVLLHGLGMASSIWQPQVDRLADAYDVVTLDMLGHGLSTLPPAEPRLADYADQVLAVLDGLGIAAAHVVGHSMGALIGVEFALAYPGRTLSVSPLNGVYCRSPELQTAVEARARALEDADGRTAPDETITRWFGDPVPPHLAAPAETTRTMLLNINPVGYTRTYRLFAQSDRRHAGRLGGLSIPALFMTGECDPHSTPAMSMAMAEAAPDSRCRILADERHMMTLTAPDTVTEALEAFFGDVLAKT